MSDDKLHHDLINKLTAIVGKAKKIERLDNIEEIKIESAKVLKYAEEALKRLLPDD